MKSLELKLILFVTLGLAVCFVVLNVAFQSGCPSNQFSSQEWKAQNGQVKVGKFTVRSTMISSFMWTYSKVKLNRVEVVQLLGQPDEIVNDIYVYNVGPERKWMSIDYEILAVSFDANSGFAKFELKCD